jgi:flagellum-specific peptidoglycan hydrolase FlgJ
MKVLTNMRNFFNVDHTNDTKLITNQEAVFWRRLRKLDMIVGAMVAIIFLCSLVLNTFNEPKKVQPSVVKPLPTKTVVNVKSDGVQEIWNEANLRVATENTNLKQKNKELSKEIKSLKNSKPIVLNGLDNKTSFGEDVQKVLAIKNTPKSAEQLAYIKKYASEAKNQSKMSGIKASVTLAQGIFESGSGNSQLATKVNNHFGIKCFEKHDHAKNGCLPLCDDCKELGVKTFWFKPYSSAAKSFADHSKKLTVSKSRYRFVFDNPKNSYVEQAYALEALGYATNSGYAEMLVGLIEKYQLYQYD